MADQKENQIKSQMKAFENHCNQQMRLTNWPSKFCLISDVKQISENQNNPVYTIYTDQDQSGVYVHSRDYHYEIDNRRFKIFVASTINNQ